MNSPRTVKGPHGRDTGTVVDSEPVGPRLLQRYSLRRPRPSPGRLGPRPPLTPSQSPTAVCLGNWEPWSKLTLRANRGCGNGTPASERREGLTHRKHRSEEGLQDSHPRTCSWFLVKHAVNDPSGGGLGEQRLYESTFVKKYNTAEETSERWRGGNRIKRDFSEHVKDVRRTAHVVYCTWLGGVGQFRRPHCSMNHHLPIWQAQVKLFQWLHCFWIIHTERETHELWSPLVALWHAAVCCCVAQVKRKKPSLGSISKMDTLVPSRIMYLLSQPWPRFPFLQTHEATASTHRWWNGSNSLCRKLNKCLCLECFQEQMGGLSQREHNKSAWKDLEETKEKLH